MNSFFDSQTSLTCLITLLYFECFMVVKIALRLIIVMKDGFVSHVVLKNHLMGIF